MTTAAKNPNVAAMSVVTSAPCARMFGSNTNKDAAISAASTPNILRALNQTNASKPKTNMDAAARPVISMRSGLAKMKAWPTWKSIALLFAMPQAPGAGSFTCMVSRGRAAMSFSKGGCSGFQPKSPQVR